MSVEFFQTRMGVTYYDHTLPSLVEAIKAQAEALKANTVAMNRLAQAQEVANQVVLDAQEAKRRRDESDPGDVP
jgi:hypothetical protein